MNEMKWTTTTTTTAIAAAIKNKNNMNFSLIQTRSKKENNRNTIKIINQHKCQYNSKQMQRQYNRITKTTTNKS